ncbi:P-type ATPase, partial [Trinorchestia longiramus]
MNNPFQITLQQLIALTDHPTLSIKTLQSKLYRNFATGTITNASHLYSAYPGHRHLPIKKLYATCSRQTFGTNTYTTSPPKSLLALFIAKAGDRILLMLLAVATVSLAIATYKQHVLGESNAWLESASIILAVGAIAAVGAVTEHVQQTLFQTLQIEKESGTVKVLEDGQMQSRRSDELLVGDHVILEPGDAVPADCLLDARGPLFCDESVLTGEASSVEKGPTNAILYAGSFVVEGVAHAMVLTVGASTRKGRLLQQLDGAPRPTPLQRRVEQLAARLSGAAVIMTLVLSAGMLLRTAARDGLSKADVLDAVIMGISIAVMVVPEGLGMVIALSQCLVTRRMLKEGNLVRNLRACEVMNGVNVVCTDKTGTLTVNRMEISEIFLNQRVFRNFDSNCFLDGLVDSSDSSSYEINSSDNKSSDNK